MAYEVDYITIASLGNAADFGDLSLARGYMTSQGDGTKGLWMGGEGPNTDTIDYINIASLGNGTDFGDLTASKSNSGSVSNGTRIVVAGGQKHVPGPNPHINEIEYFIAASLGNASDFGDLPTARHGTRGCSDGTKGVISGGYASGNDIHDEMEYFNIASVGNATDFGNLSAAKGYLGATDNGTVGRGVIMSGSAGQAGPEEQVIDYITIASLGNSADFGDLLAGSKSQGCCASGD